MSDYLAIIPGPMGAGSWARDWERAEAISRVIKIFRSDWKHLLQPKTSKTKVKVTVWVYDIEGYDEVTWDDCNMYGDGKKLDIKPEKIEHTYDRWK